MTLTTLWTTTRDDLATRRARRASDRRLARELSAYRSPADRAELDAILARHPADVVAPLERLLARSRAA